MNPGDLIRIHLFDARIPGGHALEARETDLLHRPERLHDRFGRQRLHEHQHHRLQRDAVQLPARVQHCRGAPNVIPWGFGPYMINSEFEVGHFEACTRRCRTR